MPVTRRRSITTNLGAEDSSLARIRSSNRAVEPKKTNPLRRRIRTRSLSPRSAARSAGGRSTLLWYVSRERDLAHEVHPPVAEREQHEREHQADHDAGEVPRGDDHREDHEDHEVLEPGEDLPLVPDPLDDERQPHEHEQPAHDRARDQLDDRGAGHDGGQRDERGDEARAARIDVHPRRERREAERVVPRDPAERSRHDVQHARVAQLPVGVQVPVQQDLGPSDVEQQGQGRRRTRRWRSSATIRSRSPSPRR